MKEFRYLLPASLVVFLLLSGCGPTVIVNGRQYQALTSQEEKYLQNYATGLALQAGQESNNRRNRKLSEGEKTRLSAQSPKVDISYTDNRSGRAIYEWILDGKTAIQVIIDGKLLGEPNEMSVMVRRVDLQQLDPASKQVIPHSSATLTPASFELSLPPDSSRTKK